MESLNTQQLESQCPSYTQQLEDCERMRTVSAHPFSSIENYETMRLVPHTAFGQGPICAEGLA